MSAVKNFGPLVSQLLDRLGMPVRYLADESGVSESIVHRWIKNGIAPREENVLRVARTFRIPFNVFKDAAEGKCELPSEYLVREKWDERMLGDATHSKVLDWFDRAPIEVRAAILNDVPKGREAEYLGHVTEFFRHHLGVKIKGKKKAG